jgi:hypothetical protein
MNSERLLLDLSLELSAAKESLAAVEAFKRYLVARFVPASHSHRDQDPALPFPSGKIVNQRGRDFDVLLALIIPVIFELKHCAEGGFTEQ